MAVMTVRNDGSLGDLRCVKCRERVEEVVVVVPSRPLLVGFVEEAVVLPCRHMEGAEA